MPTGRADPPRFSARPRSPRSRLPPPRTPAARTSSRTLSLSPAEQRYAESTLNLIAQTSALVDGRSTDVDAWLAQSQAWYGEAKDSYSPKSQGKSFLMTTKLVAYLKNALATLPASEFDASNRVRRRQDERDRPRAGAHRLALVPGDDRRRIRARHVG